MTDFDLYVLFSSTVSLVWALTIALCCLPSDPWCENVGGIEVLLEIAKSLSGADAGRFVNS
jgi:hypothetical protein